MKTREEIQKVIKEMEALRPEVRPFSMFGDDNLASFDVCLEVLKEDLDDDDIQDQWDIDQNYDLWSIANNTREWMDGEDDNFDPVKNWPIIK